MRTTLVGVAGAAANATTPPPSATMLLSDVNGVSTAVIRPDATSSSISCETPARITAIAMVPPPQNVYADIRKTHCGLPHSASMGATAWVPSASQR